MFGNKISCYRTTNAGKECVRAGRAAWGRWWKGLGWESVAVRRTGTGKGPAEEPGVWAVCGVKVGCGVWQGAGVACWGSGDCHQPGVYKNQHNAWGVVQMGVGEGWGCR